MRRIQLIEQARHDVTRGYFFYEGQDQGVGSYFRDSIRQDVRNLSRYFGQHKMHFGFHRSLCKIFPYAIYYRDLDEVRQIVAILDMRQLPDNIQSILQTR